VLAPVVDKRAVDECADRASFGPAKGPPKVPGIRPVAKVRRGRLYQSCPAAGGHRIDGEDAVDAEAPQVWRDIHQAGRNAQLFSKALCRENLIPG